MKKVGIGLLTSLILLILIELVFFRGIRWSDDIMNLPSVSHLADLNDKTIGVVSKSIFPFYKKTFYAVNGRPVQSGASLSDVFDGFSQQEITADCGAYHLTKMITMERQLDESATRLEKQKSMLMPTIGDYADWKDSDGDGISDTEEVSVYQSDPFNPDTDGDGYKDVTEIILGTDILKKDNIKEMRSFDMEVGTAKLSISGLGNVTNIFMDKVPTPNSMKTDFVIGDMVEITSSVPFADNGKGSMDVVQAMMLTFDISDQTGAGDLGVFTYNKATGEIKWLPFIIKGNSMVSTIQEFTVYGVAMTEAAPKKIETEIALVIDNSGSMFSLDYVEKATGEKYTPEEAIGFGVDTGFERLKMMEKLVDLLNDKFSFSVGAFQSFYDTVLPMNANGDTVKKGINRLKTEYQDFNGTNIELAVEDALEEFSDNKYNLRYIILLTDGYSTHYLYNYIPPITSVVNAANRKNVEVITIGLGNCDAVKLQQLAAGTGGIYLHANKSDALKILVKRLLTKLDVYRVDMNDDGVLDAQIIADNGFLSERDGFPYQNFGSKASEGGNCFGFSMVCKLLYEHVFPTALAETKIRGLAPGIKKIPNTLKAYEFDESSIVRMNANPVYALDVPTLFLINKDAPDDYRVLDGGVGVINPKYSQSLLDTGYEISTLNNDSKIIVGGTVPKTVESVGESFDAYSEKTVATVPRSELDFIQAINRFQNAQYDSLGIRVTDKVMHGKDFSQSKAAFVDPILTQLKEGKPALVGMNSAMGSHAVLVTKLAQDLEDRTKLYITFYDNNYPGENRVGTLLRTRAVKNAEFMDRYAFSYDEKGLKFDAIMVTEMEFRDGEDVFYTIAVR